MIPYYDKIIIKPVEKTGLIVSDTEKYEEMGTVVAIGRDVTFVSVGDTVYFLSYGCSKTPLVDGVQNFVVTEDSEIILGKDVAKK